MWTSLTPTHLTTLGERNQAEYDPIYMRFKNRQNQFMVREVRIVVTSWLERGWIILTGK